MPFLKTSVSLFFSLAADSGLSIQVPAPHSPHAPKHYTPRKHAEDICIGETPQYSTVVVGEAVGDASSTEPTPKVLEWMNSACPWEETHRSGFFLGNKYASQAKDHAKNIYKNSTGQCGPALPSGAVLKKMAGKNITFIGDSVMRQFAQSFLCYFQEHLVKDESMWTSWPANYGTKCFQAPGAKPMRHCMMTSSCAHFNHNVSICYQVSRKCGPGAIDEYLKRPERESEQAQPVIVFGSGHRDPCSEKDWNSFNQSKADLKMLMRKLPNKPQVFFQDYSPQHFPTLAQRSRDDDESDECSNEVTGTPKNKALEDFLGLPAMKSLGWRRLATYDRDSTVGNFHAARDLPTDDSDCTHWLVPGVPDTWTKELLQLLAVA